MSNHAEQERRVMQAWLLQLYRTYGTEMLQTASLVLEQQGDAEDVVQLTLLKLLRGANRLEALPAENARSIVLVETMNTAVAYCREQKKHCHLCWEELALSLPADPELENELLHRQYANALANLPDDQREALMLRYHGGFSTREIAEMLSIPQRRVRQLVQHAREALKESLEKEGLHP